MGNNIVRSNHDELKTIASKFGSEESSVGQLNQSLKSNMDTLQGGDWMEFANLVNTYVPESNRTAALLDVWNWVSKKTK